LQNTIIQKYKQDEQILKLDLLQMLKVNQLMNSFEKQVEDLTDDISEFWHDLYQEREKSNLYQNGLKITKAIDEVRDLYYDIEKNMKDRVDSKLYLIMSAFYKFVIFKGKESYDEIIKIKLAT
jgi:hypothetical protein